MIPLPDVICALMAGVLIGFLAADFGRTKTPERRVAVSRERNAGPAPELKQLTRCCQTRCMCAIAKGFFSMPIRRN
jgi:hypothetical protein